MVAGGSRVHVLLPPSSSLWHIGMASSKLRLKLLVDRSSQKVLFAEAGKDVVDFIFSILALSVGDVVRLLTKQSMVGCLGKLYESVESLDHTYVQASQSKSLLLRPRVASPSSANTALTWNKEDSARVTYYRCVDQKLCCKGYNCDSLRYGCGNFSDDASGSFSDDAGATCDSLRYGCGYFSDDAGATCSSCGHKMTTQMKYVPPPRDGKLAASGADGGQGFVKGVVTYMVMDDLVVAPMSTISSITLLNKFGVKDVGSLEEMTVELGMSEAVEMLKASLQSTAVLTDVFLKKKR